MQSINPAVLLTAFAQVPDPRDRHGRRFSLPAMLSLAGLALRANHRSVLAIAEWGASQTPACLQTLGFPDGVTPHQSTLHRLFRRLDPAALAAAVQAAVTQATSTPRARGQQGIALDGKAQRGRQAYAEPPTGAVQALSAVDHATALVLAQVPIDQLGAKAEAELTVAPRLIAQLDWFGRVLTGDALFCQRPLCQQVLAAGGDYLVLVKANQPTLADDLRLLFDPPFPAPPLDDRRAATTIDQGHGRYADTRHLVASTDLVGYLDWPGVAQVFRLERTWWARGRAHRTVHYGLTSLPPAVASADRLLSLRRGHWTIENRVHYVKDVSVGEDQSTVRLEAGPSILAILRDTALNALRLHGDRCIAARLRHYSRHPQDLFSLFGLDHRENA